MKSWLTLGLLWGIASLSTGCAPFRCCPPAGCCAPPAPSCSPCQNYLPSQTIAPGCQSCGSQPMFPPGSNYVPGTTVPSPVMMGNSPAPYATAPSSSAVPMPATQITVPQGGVTPAQYHPVGISGGAIPFSVSPIQTQHSGDCPDCNR